MKKLITLLSFAFACVQQPVFADEWDGTKYLFAPKIVFGEPGEKGLSLVGGSWGFKTGVTFNELCIRYDYSGEKKKLVAGVFNFTGAGVEIVETVNYKDRNRVTFGLGAYLCSNVPKGGKLGFAILAQPLGKLTTGNGLVDKFFEGFRVGYGYDGHGNFICNYNVINWLNKATNK